MRVAFLTNIVSPYRLPVFKRLADTPGWNLRVIVNARSEHDRDWEVDPGGIDMAVTKSWAIRRTVRTRYPVPFDQDMTLHLPAGLWSDLRAFKPDVVISHELGTRTMVASAYCRVHGVPLVVWAYQSRVSGTQGSVLKNAVRRAILRRADVVVGMGKQAREVLNRWGVNDERIVDALNAADTPTISTRYRSPECRDKAESIRKEVGRGRRIALVVGRLIPLKGTSELLDSWSRLPESVRNDWRLVFVGQGPLKQMILDADDESIVYVGGADTVDMADWYRAADLQIFPTLGDVWGLVVNEAMACGTPTLCSVHAGCYDDLIEPGVTGLGYDPTAHNAAYQIQAALSRNDLERIGTGGQNLVKSFTLDGLAEGFRSAVRCATGYAPHASAAWTTA